MKKQLFSLLLLLSFAIGVSAQIASETGQNLRKHIEYLASDQFEGRRTGEQGATGAAGYIANVFAQAKLKAGYRLPNGKGTFLQPFPFVTGVEPAATGNSSLLELNAADGKRSRMDNLPGIKAVGFSPNAELSAASVVFAGYGITSAEAKYDDYTDLDVKGKIIIVFDGTPENDNPHSQFTRFDARTKALIARDKGAAGVLLISREAKLDDDPLSRLKYDQTLGEAALPTFVVSRETAAVILGIKETEVKAIEDLTKTKAGASYDVRIRFRDTAPLLSFRVNLEKKQADAYNVIGVLEGRDPVLKNEAIVIGAHYDHLGRGGQGSLAVNSSDIHHGADDNASGTAAIMELARIFAREKNNKRTLIFIAFSGEEEGLIGSKYYVNNPVFPLEKTVAMINLDMVGRLKEDKLTIGGMGTAGEWNELVKRRNEIYFDNDNGYGVGKKFNLQLNEDGFGPSDHSSFYGKKIPVLFLFTGTHEDYHKPSDTAEKINYEGETNIVYFVADLAKAVDQNAQKPTYTVAKSSGTMGGRGFTVSLGTVPSYSESTDGMTLDGVRDNSPAAKAGLKPGDKIVKLAGKEVRNVMDYTYILGTMKAGEEYEVEIMRGTERLKLKIVPAAAARR